MLSVELLRYLQFAVEMCVLAVVVLHIKNWTGLSSAFISSIVFLVVQGISLISTPFIVEELSEIDKLLARYVFYFGFAFVNLIAVWGIFQIHLNSGNLFSKYSSAVVRLLQSLALIQVIRLVDRQIGLDCLGMAYQYIIPACNVAIVTLLLLDLLTHTKNHKIRKGF